MHSADSEQSLRQIETAGEVILGGDSGYDEARAVWNAMIDRRPAIIVRCRTTDDVIAAVKHATALDLPISIRA